MHTLPPRIHTFLEERPRIAATTPERLEQFVALLLKWNRSINLIGKSTEVDIWQRHIIDSMQLYDHLPLTAASITDFGSGAGFPGIILAFLTGLPTQLIESDKRKSAFLREAARLAPDINIVILDDRIEALAATAIPSDVITARALAPLLELFALVSPWMKKTSCGLFLKGSSVRKELDIAAQEWNVNAALFPSITSKTEEGWVVKVENLAKKLI